MGTKETCNRGRRLIYVVIKKRKKMKNVLHRHTVGRSLPEGDFGSTDSFLAIYFLLLF